MPLGCRIRKPVTDNSFPSSRRIPASVEYALISKYMKDDRFLDNGMFRFTQPASLNDVADARPVLQRDQYAPEDWAAANAAAGRNGIYGLGTDQLEDMFLTPYPSWRLCETVAPGLWPVHEPRLREEPFTSIDELDQALAERAVQLWLEQTNRSVLVFSLTTVVRSEMMHAYYGNDHNGLEVRFRSEHPFFSDRLHPIDYNDDPVSVSLNQGWVRLFGRTIKTEDILNENLPAPPLELMLRKRNEWQHENEMRLLRRPDEASTVAEDPDPRGNPVFLFEVPSDAVHSIILGYDNKEWKDVLGKISGSSRWSGVEVYRREKDQLQSVHEKRLL